MEVVEWSARLARFVSSSTPTSAIIYDAYTSIINNKKKNKKFSIVFIINYRLADFGK